MSIEAVSWALNYTGPHDLNQTQKLVLIGIANHDGDGGSWPAVATLARYAAVSERSVQRAIKDLEAVGLVTVEANGGGTLAMRNDRRPNRYILHRHGVTQDVTPSDPRGDTGDTHGVTLDAPRGDTAMSPEPSMNHPEEPSTTPLPPEGGLDFVAVSFDAWYEMYPRKQGKEAARRKWDRLPQDERLNAIAAQPAWNEHWVQRGEPQFIPMASTWVNQRRWNDDIPPLPTARPTRADRNRDTLAEFVQRHSDDITSRATLQLPGGNP